MDINKMLAKPNQTIRQHTDKLIEQAKLLNSLGYISSNAMYEDLLCACEYHDYGKGNSEFQKRLLRHNRFNTYKEIPHSVLSLFFIDENSCNDYLNVCFAVLYHHYPKVSPLHILYSEEELIKKFLLEMTGDSSIYDKLYMYIDDIGNYFKLKESDVGKRYATLLKGFLHKCDYSASAGLVCELKNDFLTDCISSWQNVNSINFNQLQIYCSENSQENILVTAPTGMGKTEAGLMWCGNNKCFFVLPLKTAINAMYDRIKHLCGSDFVNRVAIIHSDMTSKYLTDFLEDSIEEFDYEYCKKSRQMSLPITVCTPDQIFDFVLKYPGYEYKLATASYSKFIIDEIQMYSADLLASIIYAIKLIYNAGGKIAILTATLPPFVRDELHKIFGDNIKTKDFSHLGKLRHNVLVKEKVLDTDDIINIVNNTRINNVKKYLVVCNSIDTANRLYSELSNIIDDDISINLFHAGFIKKDRAEKEQAILNASKDKVKTEIWISTSVVEASLDIDFDILITELSDLFSLFQRFGRVNRKGEKDFSKTNCYVYTELQGNAKKYHFTDDTIYSLSKEALLNVSGILTEKEKTELIEKYLATDNILGSKYYEDYCKALSELEKLSDYLKSKNEGLRNIDRIDAIPYPIFEKFENEIKEKQTIINSKDVSSEDKILADQFINSLTVSVSKYRAKKSNIFQYVKGGYSNVPVIKNCEYSFENGIFFTKDKGDNQSNSCNVDYFI